MCVKAILERVLGDLVSFDKDLDHGTVKGITPYKVSQQDMYEGAPLDQIIITDKDITKILKERGFFSGLGVKHI